MRGRGARGMCAPALSLCLLLPTIAGHAQQSKDPLTPAEEEQVREASDQPSERVKLYINFIEARTAAIDADVHHPATRHPGADIHTAFDQFTRLADELGDNLDAYDQSHTDIRKGLKVLVEQSAKWPAALNEPPSSPEYDFARKTALEAAGSVSDQAQSLLKAQLEYFAKHKAPKN
jgi:hypothetical protein